MVSYNVQADYVKSLLLSRQTEQLHTAAAGIAVVSTGTAAALLSSAGSKRSRQLETSMVKIEKAQGLSAADRHQWDFPTPAAAAGEGFRDPRFLEGLKRLREREVYG